jgi:hypothetical protein
MALWTIHFGMAMLLGNTVGLESRIPLHDTPGRIPSRIHTSGSPCIRLTGGAKMLDMRLGYIGGDAHVGF